MSYIRTEDEDYLQQAKNFIFGNKKEKPKVDVMKADDYIATGDSYREGINTAGFGAPFLAYAALQQDKRAKEERFRENEEMKAMIARQAAGNTPSSDNLPPVDTRYAQPQTPSSLSPELPPASEAGINIGLPPESAQPTAAPQMMTSANPDTMGKTYPASQEAVMSHALGAIPEDEKKKGSIHVADAYVGTDADFVEQDTDPRQSDTFDKLTPMIFDLEGREDKVTTDNDGGQVKYGINSKHNPNVDIKNLTPEKATDIYRKKYWEPLGDVPEPLAAEALNLSINAGPGVAKEALNYANGSLENFIEYRKSHYNKALQTQHRRQEQGTLAKGFSPEGIAKAWDNRLAKVNEYTNGLVGSQTVVNDPEVNSVQTAMLNSVMPTETVTDVPIATPQEQVGNSLVNSFDQSEEEKKAKRQGYMDHLMKNAESPLMQGILRNMFAQELEASSPGSQEERAKVAAQEALAYKRRIEAESNSELRRSQENYFEAQTAGRNIENQQLPDRFDLLKNESDARTRSALEQANYREAQAKNVGQSPISGEANNPELNKVIMDKGLTPAINPKSGSPIKGVWTDPTGKRFSTVQQPDGSYEAIPLPSKTLEGGGVPEKTKQQAVSRINDAFKNTNDLPDSVFNSGIRDLISSSDEDLTWVTGDWTSMVHPRLQEIGVRMSSEDAEQDRALKVVQAYKQIQDGTVFNARDLLATLKPLSNSDLEMVTKAVSIIRNSSPQALRKNIAEQMGGVTRFALKRLNDDFANAEGEAGLSKYELENYNSVKSKLEERLRLYEDALAGKFSGGDAGVKSKQTAPDTYEIDLAE